MSLPDFVPPELTHGVEILNDDVTPMKFVVSVLTTHLGSSYKDSVRTMLEIHSRGGALLAMPTMAAAKKTAEVVTAEAAKQNYPLVCRAVSNIT
jgi:ATP-dependent Clp protease adapter protein ClpS